MHSKTAGVMLLAITSFATAFAQTDNPDPTLTISQWHGRDVAAGQLMVQFIDGTPAAAQQDLHDSLGLSLVRHVTDDVDLLALPDGAGLDEVLARYQAEDDVRIAEPNFICFPIYTPNDSDWGQQYGPQQIRCPEAWDTYRGGGDSIVAIIDTGVRTTHHDLDDNYAFGYDYYAGDSNPNDQAGHGTHVAGIAAAESDNSFGIAGVGHTQQYAAYRCGNGSFAGDVLATAINDAVAKGAHVLSMSWGSYGEIGIITQALNAAYEQGVVNVAAAGNDGVDRRFFPAYLLNVIGVAATNSSENKAGWSNFGDWVSVTAPGDGIYSTYNSSDTGFTWMSGTSMACPHVTGMAGFLYSRLGAVRTKANSNRIRDLIQSTSRSKDYVRYGLVDLAAALAALDAGEGNSDDGEPPGNCTRPDLYGNGTPGTGGLVPHLHQNEYAWLGNQSWTLLIDDSLPNSPGALFLGFHPDSDSSGGWERLVKPLLTFPITTDGAGTASVAIPLPNNPFLEGLNIYTQAVINDPGAGNGTAASQGFHVVFCTWDGR